MCSSVSSACLREVNHSVTRHKALEAAPTNRTLLWLAHARPPGQLESTRLGCTVFSLHCFSPKRELWQRFAVFFLKKTNKKKPEHSVEGEREVGGGEETRRIETVKKGDGEKETAGPQY